MRADVFIFLLFFASWFLFFAYNLVQNQKAQENFKKSLKGRNFSTDRILTTSIQYFSGNVDLNWHMPMPLGRLHSGPFCLFAIWTVVLWPFILFLAASRNSNQQPAGSKSFSDNFLPFLSFFFVPFHHYQYVRTRKHIVSSDQHFAISRKRKKNWAVFWQLTK